MTMPDLIYDVDARKRPDDSPSGVWSERNFTSRDAYIRADIAEELARALAYLLQSVLEDEDGVAGLDATVSAHESLAKYLEINP